MFTKQDLINIRNERQTERIAFQRELDGRIALQHSGNLIADDSFDNAASIRFFKGQIVSNKIMIDRLDVQIAGFANA